mgnify:FL=1
MIRRQSPQFDLFDNRQGDLFAAPMRPKIKPPEAAPSAATCLSCHAESEPEKPWQHDATGGPICGACLDLRELECSRCRLPFASRGRVRSMRNVLPTGQCLCTDCNQQRRMNLPQPDLRDDEATADAITQMQSLGWMDDAHRFRALYWLRKRLQGAREGGYSAKEKKAAKTRKIEAEDVAGIWPITRERPLSELAGDLWQLLDAYDQRKRAGTTGYDRELWDKVRQLEEEANCGTSFGVLVNRGPKRLWKAVRVRARAERRLPMWGVPSTFRFECRGMHIVATTASLAMQLDRDKHSAGDLSFSSTGYRSFQPMARPDTGTAARTPEEWMRGVLEAYIDLPRKPDHGGGLGGKLVRWIPWQADNWLRARHDRRMGEKAKAEGEECYQVERIDQYRQDEAKALEWMQARGIDPYALFPDEMRPAQGALI